MLKVHKQARAESDLIEIWIYSFENWGIFQADRYLDDLDEAFETIASNPDIGEVSGLIGVAGHLPENSII